MSKSAIIRGALSKIRTVGTSRKVAEVEARRAALTQRRNDPLRRANLRQADFLRAQSRIPTVSSYSLQEEAIAQEIERLVALRAVQARGGLNKVRRRTFKDAGQTRQRSLKVAETADSAVDRANNLYDKLEDTKKVLRDLQRQKNALARRPGVSKLVKLPGGNVRLLPHDRAREVLEKEISNQGKKIDRLADLSNKADQKIVSRRDTAASLGERAGLLEAQAQQMPKRRPVSKKGLRATTKKINERQAMLDRLSAPTQAAAQAAVSSVSTPAVVAGATPTVAAAAKEVAKKKGAGWGTVVGGSLAGLVGYQVAKGGFQERAIAEQAPDRMSGMILAARDQQLEMLKAMAAMQRIQVGARQSLANLAVQQPHVFNEIVAGRQLAPGVVSVCGNRAGQLQRMAEVGSGMATNAFDGMGSPDALRMLSEYMNVR